MNEGEEVKKGFFKGLGFVMALFVVLFTLYCLIEGDWLGLVSLIILCIAIYEKSEHMLILFWILNIFASVMEKDWTKFILSILFGLMAINRINNAKEKQNKEIDEAIEKELKNK